MLEKKNYGTISRTSIKLQLLSKASKPLTIRSTKYSYSYTYKRNETQTQLNAGGVIW
jgi:hypothetical protein